MTGHSRSISEPLRGENLGVAAAGLAFAGRILALLVALGVLLECVVYFATLTKEGTWLSKREGRILAVIKFGAGVLIAALVVEVFLGAVQYDVDGKIISDLKTRVDRLEDRLSPRPPVGGTSQAPR